MTTTIVLFLIATIAGSTIQFASNKEYSRFFPSDFHGMVLFDGIALTSTAIACLCAGGGCIPSKTTTFLFLIYGPLFIVTIMLMLKVMSMGPLGASSLIINMSMMIPSAAGIILWGEKLTVTVGIGIVCMILVLVLSSFEGGGKRANIRWLLLALLTMVFNGILCIICEYFPRLTEGESEFVFLFWSFLFASLICWTTVFILRKKGKDYTPWSKKPLPLIGTALGVGLGTAANNGFAQLLMPLVDAVILFPLIQGSTVLILWLVSIIVYKDKVTLTGTLALILGIAGIILLSI